MSPFDIEMDPEKMPQVKATLLSRRPREVSTRIEEEEGALVVTRHGQPTKVLIGLGTWQNLGEKLEDLKDIWLAAEARKDGSPGISLKNYMRQRQPPGLFEVEPRG